MKIVFLLLFAGCVHAQTPTATVRRDSVPGATGELPNKARNQMPTIRPGNEFYRDPKDLPRVVRATLDNMLVKGPDSSVHYTMQQVPGYVPKGLPKR